MSESITCEWCAEEVPPGSSRCPKCQGSISRTGQRVQGTPLATKPAPARPARQKPPAGWYDDPTMVNTRRYWDGQKWTQHRQEVPPPAPPASVDRNVELPVILQSPPNLLAAKGDEARTLFRWGLAMAILFPIIGFIIGIVHLGKRATWGVRVTILSILMAVIYFNLAT